MDFVPPLPKTLEKGANIRQLLKLFLRSGIAVFLPGSYDLVGVSRHKVPRASFLAEPFIFMVREPTLIRTVLVDRATDFPKGGLMDSMLRELTGHSIFVSNGATWKRQRSIIDQAFENARVRDVFDLMKESTKALVERMADLTPPGRPTRVDVDIEMTHFAGDIIFRTIYSEPLTGEDARRIFAAFDSFQAIAFAHAYLRLTGLPTKFLPSHRRGKRAAHEIRAILNGPLSRRMAQVKAGATTPANDILATLIEAADPATNTRFDEGELLDQIAMLFLAGHETSAAALGWSLYLIANRSDIQERMHKEAVAAYGDREPEFSDLRRMPFIRDVFRETLRLYPPVAFLSRDAAKAEILGGERICPGAPTIVPTWLMHRHTQYWENPHQFDPDRFADEATKEAQRCAYLPFSMGPRVCVGAAFALQEAVLALSALVRRFRFHPVPGHVPEPVSRLTVRSDNGIPLLVERR